jgi:hypothetical protein
LTPGVPFPNFFIKAFTLEDVFQVMRGLTTKGLSYETIGETREFLKTVPDLDDVCVGPMQLSIPWPKMRPFILPFKYFCKGSTGEHRSSTITPGEFCEHEDNAALTIQFFRQ